MDLVAIRDLIENGRADERERFLLEWLQINSSDRLTRELITALFERADRDD